MYEISTILHIKLLTTWSSSNDHHFIYVFIKRTSDRKTTSLGHTLSSSFITPVAETLQGGMTGQALIISLSPIGDYPADPEICAEPCATDIALSIVPCPPQWTFTSFMLLELDHGQSGFLETTTNLESIKLVANGLCCYCLMACVQLKAMRLRKTSNTCYGRSSYPECKNH